MPRPFNVKRITANLFLGTVRSRLAVWSSFVMDMAGGPNG
jgi:hypothetical protein